MYPGHEHFHRAFVCFTFHRHVFVSIFSPRACPHANIYSILCRLYCAPRPPSSPRPGPNRVACSESNPSKKLITRSTELRYFPTPDSQQHQMGTGHHGIRELHSHSGSFACWLGGPLQVGGCTPAQCRRLLHLSRNLCVLLGRGFCRAPTAGSRRSSGSGSSPHCSADPEAEWQENLVGYAHALMLTMRHEDVGNKKPLRLRLVFVVYRGATFCL